MAVLPAMLQELAELVALAPTLRLVSLALGGVLAFAGTFGHRYELLSLSGLLSRNFSISLRRASLHHGKQGRLVGRHVDCRCADTSMA